MARPRRTPYETEFAAFSLGMQVAQTEGVNQQTPPFKPSKIHRQRGASSLSSVLLLLVGLVGATGLSMLGASQRTVLAGATSASAETPRALSPTPELSSKVSAGLTRAFRRAASAFGDSGPAKRAANAEYMARLASIKEKMGALGMRRAELDALPERSRNRHLLRTQDADEGEYLAIAHGRLGVVAETEPFTQVEVIGWRSSFATNSGELDPMRFTPRNLSRFDALLSDKAVASSLFDFASGHRLPRAFEDGLRAGGFDTGADFAVIFRPADQVSLKYNRDLFPRPFNAIPAAELADEIGATSIPASLASDGRAILMDNGTLVLSEDFLEAANHQALVRILEEAKPARDALAGNPFVQTGIELRWRQHLAERAKGMREAQVHGLGADEARVEQTRLEATARAFSE